MTNFHDNVSYASSITEDLYACSTSCATSDIASIEDVAMCFDCDCEFTSQCHLSVDDREQCDCECHEDCTATWDILWNSLEIFFEADAEYRVECLKKIEDFKQRQIVEAAAETARLELNKARVAQSLDEIPKPEPIIEAPKSCVIVLPDGSAVEYNRRGRVRWTNNPNEETSTPEPIDEPVELSPTPMSDPTSNELELNKASWTAMKSCLVQLKPEDAPPPCATVAKDTVIGVTFGGKIKCGKVKTIDKMDMPSEEKYTSYNPYFRRDTISSMARTRIVVPDEQLDRLRAIALKSGAAGPTRSTIGLSYRDAVFGTSQIIDNNGLYKAIGPNVSFIMKRPVVVPVALGRTVNKTVSYASLVSMHRTLKPRVNGLSSAAVVLVATILASKVKPVEKIPAPPLMLVKKTKVEVKPVEKIPAPPLVLVKKTKVEVKPVEKIPTPPLVLIKKTAPPPLASVTSEWVEQERSVIFDLSNAPVIGIMTSNGVQALQFC